MLFVLGSGTLGHPEWGSSLVVMCQLLWFTCCDYVLAFWAGQPGKRVLGNLLSHCAAHLNFLNSSVFLGWPRTLGDAVCGLQLHPCALTVVFAVTSVHLAWPCVSCRYPPGCHRGHRVCSKGASNAFIGELLESCYFNEAKGFHLALGTFLPTHTRLLPLFLLNDRWYFGSQSSGCFKMPQMICLCCDDS